MLETWIQWTCDGCGDTESSGSPDDTRKEVRKYLRTTYGWLYKNGHDYCRTCRGGKLAKAGKSMFSTDDTTK